tara:strand:- start:12891 stop:13715 length:825 start_codon:yes stop_codon:yes gene_type:complete
MHKFEPIIVGETAAILADPHFRYGEILNDIIRIEAFARFCLKNRIPLIICLGDWFDFPSLADYLSAKGLQNKTVRKDLEAGIAALKMLHKIWDDFNKKERRAGRSHNQYKPRLVLVKGNHDVRPAKIGNENIKLADEYTERYIDEDFLDRGWEVYQFLDIFKWQGIRFSHYFKSGSMGKACPLTQASKNIGRSAVWGHSHKFEMLRRQVAKDDERDIWVSAPAFLPEWRLQKNEDNGFLVLSDAVEGNFALNHVSYNYLINNYSQDVKRNRRAA